MSSRPVLNEIWTRALECLKCQKKIGEFMPTRCFWCMKDEAAMDAMGGCEVRGIHQIDFGHMVRVNRKPSNVLNLLAALGNTEIFTACHR